MPGKYEPLAAYLAAPPAEVHSVTVTFAEAGALLGGSLPMRARGPTWWKTRPPAARRPGWQVGAPHITPDGWSVTFRRADTTE